MDPGNALFSDHYRQKTKQMKFFGYWAQTWNVCDSEVGAACRSSHTVTFCGLCAVIKHLPLSSLQTPGGLSTRGRPSDNHLTHYNIPRNKFRPSHQVVRSPTNTLHRGLLNGDPVFDPGVCIPCQANIWVETTHGCRRVTVAEWMMLKGFPKGSPNISISTILECPSIHLWAAIGERVMPLLAPSIAQEKPSLNKKETEQTPNMTRPDRDKPMLFTSSRQTDREWTWQPHSFRKRGRWYRKRVSNLRRACANLPAAEKAFEHGLSILELHKLNYSNEGPKHLVLLWWEWPEEHHDTLRHGISMNFMSPPRPGIKQNARMNDQEKEITGKFVDELISLGVLEPESPPETTVNTCPLFLVPKSGQPGEYCCIADMKKGGQNEVVGSDPVHMTSPMDILPRLYTGGYSATLDIAKYFHMFPTIEAECQYLGCIPPTTGKMFRYKTLPMGAGNSPGGSARFGCVFIRMVVDTRPSFQGSPVQNDYAQGFAGKGYNSRWGIGRVLICTDGLPACIIWIHVDDLLIHGPTYEKCLSGLQELLEPCVHLGFICQSIKIIPPCQCVKYCGFLYDTVAIPTMRIPSDKISRGLSQIAYIRRPDVRLSRLGLAITVGNLQSMVPASPNNI
jgi:hypothetical protein